MIDEELHHFDHEQLLTEEPVLEELLKENPNHARRTYWLDELKRVKNVLRAKAHEPEHLSEI